RREWVLAMVFVAVCGLWVTSGWSHIDITWTALCGGAVLILTGVLPWEDIKGDTAAWDIFIWFGGLVMLGKALNDAKVTTEFAKLVAGAFTGSAWVWLFAAALVIYFYAHYAFASITAHLLAMYPPFLVVLLAKGAPPGLVIFSFASFASLSAGLTHYGTTPAPMYFAQNYVSLKQWWKIGLVVSFMNLAIWVVVGFSWWKLVGIW
ncbi:MAG: SLC13 family permease, partial [Terriglobia bacterium]